MYIKNRINKIRFGLSIWIVIPVVMMMYLSSYMIKEQDVAGISDSRVYSEGEPPIDVPSRYLIDKKPEEPFVWENTGLVTIWFDDAWENQYEIGSKILDAFGYKAALAVPTSHTAFTAYMNWDQIRELQKKGWEISSHSVNHHCDLDNEDTIKYEMKSSRQVLLSEGLPAKDYVEPCGIDNPAAIDLSKKYYRSFRSTEEGLNPIPVKDAYALRVVALDRTASLNTIADYINQAKVNKLWIILMAHQIDDESTFGISRDDFIRAMWLIKNSGMPVVVPSQVLQLGDQSVK